jgi:hypothetical protein
VEIFPEISKNLTKVLYNGQVESVEWSGQLIVTDLTEQDKEILKLEDDVNLIPVSGRVPNGTPEEIRGAVRNHIQKYKRNMFRRIRARTEQPLVINEFKDKLTTRKDL